MKVSEYIADWLAEKNIRHVFGIVGAGNAHLFDAITRKGFTEIVCVHHEQAACMAMQTYYRTSGIVTAAILTTGGGSTNATTGVVGAWADSIPGLVISGNENAKFTRTDNPLRMWGVQGYDSAGMMRGVTKYASRVMNPECAGYELEKAYQIAQAGRPGPCWVDVPMSVQSSSIAPEALVPFLPGEDADLRAQTAGAVLSPEVEAAAGEVMEHLRNARRPLLWLGHGIRLAEATNLIEPLLAATGAPALVSWAGMDMVDSDHPQVVGRAGVYGQRAANFILQNCDFLLCVGTRLAIPQIGYDLSEFARAAEHLAVVDVDPAEAIKHAPRVDLPIVADAKVFLTALLEKIGAANADLARPDWMAECDAFRAKYPWVGPEHADAGGFINSYPFMERLSDHLKADQVVVTDMGTALLSGHQVLRFNNGQRLMTSTGLGEMGFGLPGALGASFARDRGEVLCLNCDGGMMMNLQELQTIVHHRLPIKIIVFNNDGYLMIKHTQKALFQGHYSGTDRKSGVSCPDFSALAQAFEMPAFQIRTWDDFDAVIPQFQAHDGPAICEVFMHPEQLFVPKLGLAVQPDGSLISPPLEDLSPFLDRTELEQAMQIAGMHEKSRAITVSSAPAPTGPAV